MPKSSKAKTRSNHQGSHPSRKTKAGISADNITNQAALSASRSALGSRNPQDKDWIYEPQVGRLPAAWPSAKDKKVLLQSKAGQPLGRYFPELVAALGNCWQTIRIGR